MLINMVLLLQEKYDIIKKVNNVKISNFSEIKRIQLTAKRPGRYC